MTSITTLAAILLSARLVAQVLIFSVLLRQYPLLKAPIIPDWADVPSVKHVRTVLFVLALVLFIGNLIPIVIDSLTLFINTGRPAQLGFTSVVYTLSVALVSMISAYLIHRLYKLAASTKVASDKVIDNLSN